MHTITLTESEIRAAAGTAFDGGGNDGVIGYISATLGFDARNMVEPALAMLRTQHATDREAAIAVAVVMLRNAIVL